MSPPPLPPDVLREVRARLRAADPVIGLEDEEAVLERLAARLGSSALRQPIRPGLHRHPLLAAAALALLAVGFGWWSMDRGRIDPSDMRRQPASIPAPAPAVSATPAHARARTQMQFETPGGTRVIWTLDPDLSL